MVEFHKTLSEQSIYYRYFTALNLSQRVTHERLTRICFNDYDREIALVVDRKKTNGDGHEILGVGRLSKLRGTNEAEFALLLSDRWQKKGIGTELLKLLVEIGRKEKLARIIGSILLENRAMQHVCKKVGFNLVHDPEGGQWQAVMDL